MDERIKDQWVKALRSGEYIQTRGELRACLTNNFCCLGVLCDIMKEEFGGEWEDGGCFIFQGDLAGGDIPTDLRETIGLSYEDQEFLTVMNDDERSSFKEIADHIEKEF